jgi:hypothetical protein
MSLAIYFGLSAVFVPLLGLTLRVQRRAVKIGRY